MTNKNMNPRHSTAEIEKMLVISLQKVVDGKDLQSFASEFCENAVQGGPMLPFCLGG
jgi:hypothetical protein